MVKKLLMIILVNVLLYSLVACTPMPPTVIRSMNQ